MGRPAQEVAPVREQGAERAAIVVVDAEGDRLGEFYRIYRETAARAGFLIRTEAAYRDVWEAYPAGRPRAAAVRPDAGRRAAGDAVPRALRAARGGALRRDDRGRRRVTRELPAQVGGHPVLARAGRDELRPVGPRDGRDRPLQDRVRRPRGPLHRRVGPGARPARADRSTRAAGARRTVGAPAARARHRRRPARPRRSGPTGDGERRPRGRRRDELADWDRGRSSARRPRLPVAGLGRAPARDRLAAALPDRRRRAPALVLERPWPLLGGAAPTSRAGRSLGARRRDGDAAAARLVAIAAGSAASGVDVVADRRRGPGRDRRTAGAAGGRLPPDRGDPAVAPPAVAAARPGHRRRRRRSRGIEQVDAPADPRGARRGDVRVVALRPGRGAGRRRPLRGAARAGATRRSTGSTTAARATGQRRHFRFGPRDRVRRVVDAAHAARLPRLPRGARRDARRRARGRPA